VPPSEPSHTSSEATGEQRVVLTPDTGAGVASGQEGHAGVVTATPEAASGSAANGSRTRWRNRARNLFVLLVVLACLFVAVRYDKSDLMRLRGSLGMWAPIISVPLQAVVAATPLFPSDLICIANGAVYGYVAGIVYSYIGWYLGAMLEFAVVLSIRQTETAEQIAERMPRWLRQFPAGSPWFLILGRQIPWGGAHLTIVGAAAAGVSWQRFLWCTAIAVLPGAFVMPAIGAQLW